MKFNIQQQIERSAHERPMDLKPEGGAKGYAPVTKRWKRHIGVFRKI